MISESIKFEEKSAETLKSVCFWFGCMLFGIRNGFGGFAFGQILMADGMQSDFPSFFTLPEQADRRQRKKTENNMD